MKQIHTYKNTIEYKKYLFKKKIILFQLDKSMISNTDDFIYLIGLDKPIGNNFYPRPTIINDITISEKEIFKKFSSTTKNKINRVSKNLSNVKYKFYENPSKDIFIKSVSELQSFVKKRLITNIDFDFLKELFLHKLLFISVIESGDAVFIHFYRVACNKAELLHSLSRGCKENRELAFINRYSHWMDILNFKRFGYLEYDFGGYYDGLEDEKLIKINDFKMDFGGEVRMRFNSMIYNSFKAKTYLRLKPLFRLLKN